MSGAGPEPAWGAAGLVVRRSYGKLVAILSARSRDVAAVEDALADALTAALTEWPRSGCPNNPEAWLLTVARRKLIDASRRQRSAVGAAAQLAVLESGIGLLGNAEPISDQRLALMFVCAHPSIEPGIRAPLILQSVLGLDAVRIASAFLISPATMGKRLVRAKEKILRAGIPFRIPETTELRERLNAVLEAIYAAFAEGWSDAAGTDVTRRDLTEEAIYLGRLVAELLPCEPEALGLVALMLHAEARRGARRNAAGDYVPLAEQDGALWDLPLIDEAEALLLRASGLGSVGRFQLEAALQSAHVYRRRTGLPNGQAVVELYDALLALSASPVVAINRALAILETQGAAAALAALPDAAADARLVQYQPYWAARAELLAKTGARAAAAEAYGLAMGLTGDPAVRRFLQARRAQHVPANRVDSCE